MLEFIDRIVRSRWFWGITIVLLLIAVVLTFVELPRNEPTKAAVERFVAQIPIAAVVAGGLALSAAGYGVYRAVRKREMGWNNKSYELDSNNHHEYDEAGPRYKENDHEKVKKDVTFTSLAKKLGWIVFKPIGSGEEPPGLPTYAENQGVQGGGKILIPNHKYVTGFQGKAPNDLASVFHLVVIPKNKTNADGVLIDKLHGNRIPAHIGDANDNHLDLLDEMEQAAKDFFVENRAKLEERFGADVIAKEMEKGIQMGFHLEPSIGYIHMHALLGPLTESGVKEAHKWISLSDARERLANTPPDHQTEGIRAP